MVLTFTGSLSAAESGRNEVRTMLIGALGCNLAWGIIDAIFYLMNVLGYRGHGAVALRRLHRTTDPAEARALIADALPPVLAATLEPQDFETDPRAAGHASGSRRPACRSTGTTCAARSACSSSCSCRPSRWPFPFWS